MYDLILRLLTFCSLGVMVYLLARALPRLSDGGSTEISFFDRLIDRLPLERIDLVITSLIARFLNRAKVIVARLDSIVNSYIEQIRLHSPALRAAQQQERKEKMEAMQDGVEKNSENR